MRKILFAIIALITIIRTSDAQTLNGEVLSVNGGITVVKVWGTHYERGYACGFLLHSEIRDVYENYLLPRFGQFMATAKTVVEQGQHISISTQYIVEAEGMVAGLAAAGENIPGVDYRDILVANSYLDLQAMLSKDLGLGNGCSSLMSWGGATNGTDLQGKSVVSRHLDWEDDPVIINNQVIVVHIPSESDEQPWLLVGFAGQISALSGVNNAGITAFQHMMSDCYSPASYNMAYEPVWFSIRKGLEKYDFNNDQSNDVQDIRSVLASSVNGYADGFIVAALGPSTDTDSLTAVVAELAPQAPLHTWRCNDFPDSIPGYNLYAANFEIKRNNHVHLCSRYINIMNAIGTGKGISAEVNRTLMREYSNGGSSNIQFMQVIPEERVMNLAVYHDGSPAWLNDSVVYNLDTLFEIPTGMINNRIEKEKLSVFPNPFHNKTNIYFPNPDNKNFELTVFDLTGKKLRKESGKRNNRIEFNREGLPEGIYLFRLSCNGAVLFCGKLMIIKE